MTGSGKTRSPHRLPETGAREARLAFAGPARQTVR